MKEKQRKQIDIFLKQAQEAHGVYYNYSKVNYINDHTNVVIICPEHGEFTQPPGRHLTGAGCAICGRIKAAHSRAYTKEEYLAKCKELHNSKYEYDLDNYINLKSEIIIICPVHGKFNQQACVHLSGSGCTQCGIISRTEKWKLTTEEVIARAKIVHGDTYLYDEFLYTTHHGHVTIICRVHGPFTQNPWNHLSGTGCKRCTKIYNTEDFIKKASEIHTIAYDYSRVDYKNSHAKIIIGCPECGLFEQAPNSHLCGGGCPTCLNKTERKLFLWLKTYYEVVTEFKQPWCVRESTGKELRFDFLLKEFNIIIELDGGQHFKQVRNWLSPEQQIRIDVYKMQQANKNGYTVIRLLQSDVYRNPITWLEENLKQQLHTYDEPANLVIYDEDKNCDIYSRHLSLLEELDVDLEFGDDEGELSE